VRNEAYRDILVCGYTNFLERSSTDRFQFVPVNIILDPVSGTITGVHTPIYNPLIDAELERIFLGNSIYASMDVYVQQIRSTMHFPSINLLIKALYDLYGNFLRAIKKYWTSIRIPKVEPGMLRFPGVHYDYFCGTTRLSERLNSVASNEMSMFAKVNATSKKIEDCWVSKFSAFPDENLCNLFCGYGLDEDPQRVVNQIRTYYRITANKAIINLFMNLVDNCLKYYANQKGEQQNGVYAAR
jgi:hypothetical protein